MKVLRVFPRRTTMTPIDEFSFVGDPPMQGFRPAANEVHISVVFTWDKSRAERLRAAWRQYYHIVKVGGPAYDTPCNGFVPGFYIREGITFTSRGCNNHCPWCEVPKREGKIKELSIIQPGNVIQDNNLLQCSQSHLDKVFTMLRHQHQVDFQGGLDSRLLTNKIADQIRGLRLRQVFFAADTREAIKPLRKALKTLQLPRDKVRCYVLLKFNPGETIPEARERMELVWEAGAMPFAQLYQPTDRHIEYPEEWRAFARTWSRPAAMKAEMSKYS
jgi:hypothetical protein